MQSMKEINKEFIKDIIRKNGLPDTLEEALEWFDKVTDLLKLIFKQDFNIIEFQKARNYLIDMYKTLEE